MDDNNGTLARLRMTGYNSLIDEAKERHPKMSPQELYSQMRDKGITFNNSSPDEVVKTLENLNYYYKLNVYRRNFQKKNGKYCDLDFSYLKKISNKDMELRYILLQFFLDIEHALKTFILTDITNNDSEDGYTIVPEFFASTEQTEDPKYSINLDDVVKKAKGSKSYQHAMFEKNNDCIPVWTMLEYLSFGNFARFFKFYYTKNKKRGLNISSIFGTIEGAKSLRNACAHSNPVLFNIKERKISHPSKVIRDYCYSLGLGREVCKYSRIYDLLCVFYLHNKFVKGEGSRRFRYAAIKSYLTICNEELTFIGKENDLYDYFRVLNKIVDNYDV